MISVTCIEDFEDQVDIDALAETAQAVLEKMHPHTQQSTNSEVSIEISNDATLQQLNWQYMGKDAPTDVLSFPIDFENPDTGNPYLGDILISYPTAQKQAEAGGHTLEDELKLLVIHGMLHLLGYDHVSPEEKADMWAFQDSLMADLHIQATPTE